MKESKNTKKLPGFYIALCCCVVAIGVAGFIAENDNSGNSGNSDIVTVTQVTSAPISENENDLLLNELAGNDETVTEAPVIPVIEEYAIDNPDIEPASVTVKAEEAYQFSDPLAEMTILYGYITDNLAYNEVYGDWRTHNGLDIAAPIGCSVNAVSGGTVTDIIDGSYGKTVKIEHTGGFISIYSQLDEISVKVGDTIDSGSVIGTIGESIGENCKEPHLHFELHKDGKPVNPEEY